MVMLACIGNPELQHHLSKKGGFGSDTPCFAKYSAIWNTS